jgi:hypothetical protein
MGYVGMVFTRLYMVDDKHVAHALSHLHIFLLRCKKMMKCASFKVLGKKMPCERMVSLSEFLCYKPF